MIECGLRRVFDTLYTQVHQSSQLKLKQRRNAN